MGRKQINYSDLPEGTQEYMRKFTPDQKKIKYDNLANATHEHRVALAHVGDKDYLVVRPDAQVGYKIKDILENFEKEPDKFNRDFANIWKGASEMYSQKELTETTRQILMEEESALKSVFDIYYGEGTKIRLGSSYFDKMQRVESSPGLAPEIHSMFERIKRDPEFARAYTERIEAIKSGKVPSPTELITPKPTEPTEITSPEKLQLPSSGGIPITLGMLPATAFLDQVGKGLESSFGNLTDIDDTFTYAAAGGLLAAAATSTLATNGPLIGAAVAAIGTPLTLFTGAVAWPLVAYQIYKDPAVIDFAKQDIKDIYNGVKKATVNPRAANPGDQPEAIVPPKQEKIVTDDPGSFAPDISVEQALEDKLTELTADKYEPERQALEEVQRIQQEQRGKLGLPKEGDPTVNRAVEEQFSGKQGGEKIPDGFPNNLRMGEDTRQVLIDANEAAIGDIISGRASARNPISAIFELKRENENLKNESSLYQGIKEDYSSFIEMRERLDSLAKKSQGFSSLQKQLNDLDYSIASKLLILGASQSQRKIDNLNNQIAESEFQKSFWEKDINNAPSPDDPLVKKYKGYVDYYNSQISTLRQLRSLEEYNNNERAIRTLKTMIEILNSDDLEYVEKKTRHEEQIRNLENRNSELKPEVVGSGGSYFYEENLAKSSDPRNLLQALYPDSSPQTAALEETPKAASKTPPPAVSETTSPPTQDAIGITAPTVTEGTSRLTEKERNNITKVNLEKLSPSHETSSSKATEEKPIEMTFVQQAPESLPPEDFPDPRGEMSEYPRIEPPVESGSVPIGTDAPEDGTPGTDYYGNDASPASPGIAPYLPNFFERIFEDPYITPQITPSDRSVWGSFLNKVMEKAKGAETKLRKISNTIGPLASSLRDGIYNYLYPSPNLEKSDKPEMAEGYNQTLESYKEAEKIYKEAANKYFNGNLSEQEWTEAKNKFHEVADKYRSASQEYDANTKVTDAYNNGEITAEQAMDLQDRIARRELTPGQINDEIASLQQQTQQQPVPDGSSDGNRAPEDLAVNNPYVLGSRAGEFLKDTYEDYWKNLGGETLPPPKEDPFAKYDIENPLKLYEGGQKPSLYPIRGPDSDPYNLKAAVEQPSRDGGKKESGQSGEQESQNTNPGKSEVKCCNKTANMKIKGVEGEVDCCSAFQALCDNKDWMNKLAESCKEAEKEYNEKKQQEEQAKKEQK